MSGVWLVLCGEGRGRGRGELAWYLGLQGRNFAAEGETQQQGGTYLLLRPVDEFFIYIFCLLETKTNLPPVVTRAASHVGLYMDQAVL